MGQRLKLTKQIIREVEKLFSECMYMETIGDYLGIHRTTWKKWQVRGRREYNRLARLYEDQIALAEQSYLPSSTTSPSPSSTSSSLSSIPLTSNPPTPDVSSLEFDQLDEDDITLSPLPSEKLYYEFFMACKRGLAKSERKNIRIIQKSAESQWYAAAWILERRFPKRWTKRELEQVVNNVMGSLVSELRGQDLANPNVLDVHWDQIEREVNKVEIEDKPPQPLLEGPEVTEVAQSAVETKSVAQTISGKNGKSKTKPKQVEPKTTQSKPKAKPTNGKRNGKPTKKRKR